MKPHIMKMVPTEKRTGVRIELLKRIGPDTSTYPAPATRPRQTARVGVKSGVKKQKYIYKVLTVIVHRGEGGGGGGGRRSKKSHVAGHCRIVTQNFSD